MEEEQLHQEQATQPMQEVTELEKALQERDEYLAGWQRAKADAINEKQRTAKMFEEFSARSIAGCVEKLLPVLDSLQMALEHTPKDNPAFAGINLTHNQCINSFKEIGVTVLNPMGEQFNPQFHESVEEVAIDNTGGGVDNSIVKVVRMGAMIGNLLVRPATVHVAHYKTN